jgi:hypothetical protein
VERRFRFLTEVSGLRALDGNGVPLVFEANEQLWREKEVELYLVMEFVEGPTLNDKGQCKRSILRLRQSPQLYGYLPHLKRAISSHGHGCINQAGHTEAPEPAQPIPSKNLLHP